MVGMVGIYLRQDASAQAPRMILDVFAGLERAEPSSGNGMDSFRP
jgi:hypothetical protein